MAVEEAIIRAALYFWMSVRNFFALLVVSFNSAQSSGGGECQRGQLHCTIATTHALGLSLPEKGMTMVTDHVTRSHISGTYHYTFDRAHFPLQPVQLAVPPHLPHQAIWEIAPVAQSYFACCVNGCKPVSNLWGYNRNICCRCGGETQPTQKQ